MTTKRPFPALWFCVFLLTSVPLESSAEAQSTPWDLDRSKLDDAAGSGSAAPPSADGAGSEAGGGGAAEMARKLQDPLANIRAFMTDNQISFGAGAGDTAYSFQLQPIYAFDFPDQGFTFLPRALIPLLGVAPLVDLPPLGDPRPRGGGTTWGLGDIVTQFFFAPKLESSWKVGLGPQLSWKTRTDSRLGGPGWGAGVAGVVVGEISGFAEDKVSIATIISNQWSYDGDFSTFLIQPNVFYNFASLPGAYVAYAAAISADWKARSNDVWTVPLGASVGKTFDINGYGLDVNVGPYYNVVTPDLGSTWSLRFQINFLLP